MDAQTSFPIVEDGRLVHFVYRGEAEDVAVRGNMLANRGRPHDPTGHGCRGSQARNAQPV